MLDEKNVAMLSIDHYNTLAKAARNTAYLTKIKKSRNQLAEGMSYTFSLDELISMENMTPLEARAFAETRKNNC